MNGDNQVLLQVNDLHKHYKKVYALKGVDLNVRRGETVVIMGPSGCGKSTLIRCINRLVEPDAGEIIFNGQELTGLGPEGMRAIRPHIGFVFQHFNLIKRLSALDNVGMGLRLQGKQQEEVEDRSLRALEQVGLKKKAHHFPHELSGGEQQRVGIARALAMEPLLMLWDEPTASLDPILVGEVLEVMEELVRNDKTTMIIVTHELHFARKAADRVVFMSGGTVAEEGRPETVFEQPRSEVGRKYKKLLQHS
ncbi:MAG TPA: amino acid ABC transporter ATP-binding protein [Firmicutes bacterium]|jgi:polar amino acid transport system ATP-binding protein|nr:amino acid ABC transporter ATP-binding protein [Bacillota bacterium]HOQ23166.1 amino acid ABC transporter ATP-binding protein [Bacillota bacterium]HPT66595.1 amino acid ABC transporter ATP-binding protein [Bacillota bacterium]